jgi:O-antigen/teichoic acid export membrane protein
MSGVNNKLIAKNTIALYIRTLVVLFISLYTSRVVLNTLGVEDFGIYNVVAGVISIFSFLNISMSGATSRFLTYEIGKKDNQRLKETFSSALTIHIGIALLVLLFSETAGLWFVNHKLVIPADRMLAANWVFQFAVFSSMLGIIQVPYNASLIAYEKMNVYAGIDIMNVLLKLLIVYLLLLGNFDRLIFYSFLVLFASLLVTVIYILYCVRKLVGCSYAFTYRKETLKPMLSFSGWDLFGNLSITAQQQGANILLNIFGGVVLNAASGIAGVVKASSMKLSSNIIVAFNPQIIKQYSVGNYKAMENLMNHAVKFSSILFIMLCIPMILEMHYLLKLWLGNVPDYAVRFSQISLFGSFFMLANPILVTAIHATGKIKRLTFSNGLLYLLTLLLIYIALYIGMHPAWVYVFICIISIFIVGINLHIVKSLIPSFSIFRFLSEGFVKNIFTTLIAIILPILIVNFMDETFWRFITVIFISVSSICLLSYFIILNRKERLILRNYIRKIIKI